MPLYENRKGGSSIISFDLKKEAILVTFKTGSTYEYNYLIPGPEHVENMIAFAVNGQGLAHYIKESVGVNYYKKHLSGKLKNILFPDPVKYRA